MKKKILIIFCILFHAGCLRQRAFLVEQIGRGADAQAYDREMERLEAMDEK